MKYRVVYKKYGQWLDSLFGDIDCAFEYARKMNGIVLNVKGER